MRRAICVLVMESDAVVLFGFCLVLQVLGPMVFGYVGGG